MSDALRTTTTNSVHIVLLCWPSVRENVRSICLSLDKLNCRKTVIDASGLPNDFTSTWDWRPVDTSYFYGKKMNEALHLLDEDIFIQVQGDLSCDNWETLVSTCIERLSMFPTVGVWSADVENTGWPTAKVSAAKIENSSLEIVCQTDCLCWAMRRPIYDRLRRMNFDENNLGWGVDWAAIVSTYANGFVAVRDRAAVVYHPTSRGYDSSEALKQQSSFLNQLELNEKALFAILMKSMGMRGDLVVDIIRKHN